MEENKKLCLRCGKNEPKKRSRYCQDCKKLRKAETDKEWRKNHPKPKVEGKRKAQKDGKNVQKPNPEGNDGVRPQNTGVKYPEEEADQA